MKTLIYGAGPIGQWLALRLERAGNDVTVFDLAEDFDSIANLAGMKTPTLDELIESVRRSESETDNREVA